MPQTNQDLTPLQQHNPYVFHLFLVGSQEQTNECWMKAWL